MLTLLQGAFEEAENSYRSQIKILEEDLARQKRLLTDATNRYRREQALMLSVIHGMGMHTAREQLGYAKQQSRPEPTSWLKQQRQNVCPTLDHPLSVSRSHNHRCSLALCSGDDAGLGLVASCIFLSPYITGDPRTYVRLLAHVSNVDDLFTCLACIHYCLESVFTGGTTSHLHTTTPTKPSNECRDSLVILACSAMSD